ncbi:MAG: hypothetical protein CL758_04790 [Chloroflexi bacterium]|nr:hypothetical protein [Chloroflexota bacterium]|tara:strand:- start:179 stop:1012 length:834 start_codon:yes stop_codon:yes gene_type:complete
MKIGVSVLPTDYSPDITLIAKELERLQFESLWVEDHPLLPVSVFMEPKPGVKVSKILADVADPFVSLARASSVTNKLKLAIGQCLVIERNPILLSKEVASLDMFSKGRFIFGIGVSQFAEETSIMGGDCNNIWANIEEAVLSMKVLWTETKSEFSGNYYQFPPVFSFPSSISKPHPPLLAYADGEQSYKYICKWGDGIILENISPDELVKQKSKLDNLLTESNRNFDITIKSSKVSKDLELINEFESVGVDRLIIDLYSYDTDQSIQSLQDIADKIK